MVQSASKFFFFFWRSTIIETRFRAVRVELTGRRAGNDRTLSGKMDGQNSELVKQQVQAELANAYAQEFFTVRMPDLVLDLFPTLPLVPPPPPPGPRC